MDARTLRGLAQDPTWVPSAAERAELARVFVGGESLIGLEPAIALMTPDVWREHILDKLRALDHPVRYWRVAEFFDHLDLQERCLALMASRPHSKFLEAEAEKLAGLDMKLVRERHPELAPHLLALLVTLLAPMPPAWVDDVWVDALCQPWPPETRALDPDYLELSERCLASLTSVDASRATQIVDRALQAAAPVPEGATTIIRAHSFLQFASARHLAGAWEAFIATNLYSGFAKRTWNNAWQSAGRRYPAGVAVLVPTLQGGDHALVIAEAIGRVNLPVFAEANVALLGDSRKTVREVAKLNLVNLGTAAEAALQAATKARKKAVRTVAKELLTKMNTRAQSADLDVDEVKSKHDAATAEFWNDAYDQLGSAIWNVAATRFAHEPRRFGKTPLLVASARPDDKELRAALFSAFCVIPRAWPARGFIEALIAMDIARVPGFADTLSAAPHRLDFVRWVHEQKQGSQELWRALLLSKDRSIRALATDNVERTKELLDACAQLLDESDSERRVLGATLASSIEGPAARALLAKFLADADNTVRDIAAVDAGSSAPSVTAAELLEPFATSDTTTEEWGTIRDVDGAELNASAVVAALRTEDGSFTSALLTRLAPLLDKGDAAQLSAKLLDRYMAKIGDISLRALLFQVGWIGHLDLLLRFGRTPEELQPYGFQVGKWLMATLAQLNTPEADSWLHYWTRHATAPSIQREAWRRLAARAEEQNTTPLAYMATLDPFIAALAPAEPSSVSVDTDAGAVTLQIVAGEVSIEVDGVSCRSLPKSAASARQALKVFRSEARSATKKIISDLEEAMVLGRRWTSECFAAERRSSQLFRWATHRLVCWFGDELGVMDEDRFVTVDLETRSLGDLAAPIRIAHVAELDPPALRAWGDYFAEHELSQPFEQLARQATAFDESSTTRYDKLGRQAAKLSWRNFGETESIDALDRCYWGYGARAVITAHKVVQLRSGTLSYTDLSGAPLELSDVHPVVLLESRRDAAVLFS